MEKNTITLAKYLFTKGVDLSSKIQKILFFFRVEELKAKKNFGFFKEKNNFQAWIFGPVNSESFFEMQRFFTESEEKDIFILNSKQVKKIDQYYGKWFEKYNKYSASQLIAKSHKNLSWKNARGTLPEDVPCKKFLKEDETFLEFEN